VCQGGKEKLIAEKVENEKCFQFSVLLFISKILKLPKAMRCSKSPVHTSDFTIAFFAVQKLTLVSENVPGYDFTLQGVFECQA
jgi:hypothetical protein